MLNKSPQLYSKTGGIYIILCTCEKQQKYLLPKCKWEGLKMEKNLEGANLFFCYTTEKDL